ncbi:lamin tail domain-containing protein [Fulvivirga sp. 29W222]|uniref:Lamin tail domain-containing protein n=1 Tax=Fulvivirga marina TaxID=2494733 RepID=A0A937KBW9_9BACT|nr:lamin tail domain-containing protein [Fulvivirga marina]MBL6447496.1 lamin tail domain-containing protein [Fulvivirga marina]
MVKFPCQSQFTDDFSDGDLSISPAWSSSNQSGAGFDFYTAGGELQSNGPEASATLWISTNGVPDVTQQEVAWEFKARYEASPSSSNNVEIYLLSNSSDLTNAEEGYFIRLGESGSGDGIDLFKTGSTTPLISDPNPSVATGFNVNIRITRKASGQWVLEADTSGGESYKAIGTAVDEEFINGAYFGFKVEHSSTKNQAFYFDDVAVTSKDTKAPGLVSTEVVSSTRIDLFFSENIDTQTGEDASNYFADSGIGYPASARVDHVNPSIVHLDFVSSFPVGSPVKISITGIQDLFGNMVSSILSEFLYFVEEVAEVKDVIITEILADPSPPNDLPDKEFVEIYNNSDKIFGLSGWHFSDLKERGALSNHYLFPGKYLILCPKEAVEEFGQYGAAMGLDPWPTLNNGEDFIVIKDNDDHTIDSVHYSKSWYKSSSKSDGGWTLELIDPDNLCSNGNNWTASEHLSGGTPGITNSVLSQNPDLTSPELIEVLGLRPDSVVARFNEVLDTEITPDNFVITPYIDISNVVLGDSFTEVDLKLSGQLHGNTAYTLGVKGIKDCSGNFVSSEEALEFYLTEPADSLDIIINEVLFNPYSGGVDFVELYNNSSKHINLKGRLMANGVKQDGQYFLKEIFPAAVRDVVLEPHSYIVVTEDAIRVKEQYPMSEDRNLNEVKKLPAYNDNGGVVILINQDSAVLDLLEYSEEWQFELLTDKEGVSLERVSFTAPTNDGNNWKSAASTVGFATPGYVNSQVKTGVQVVNGNIVADPKVIIPDGSGQNDFTTITYAFDQPGYVANSRIVDAFGRTIKTLGENDYLATEGFYTWDATDDSGAKVRTGYYLVYLEVFNLNGDLLQFKEKVVVGTKF